LRLNATEAEFLSCSRRDSLFLHSSELSVAKLLSLLPCSSVIQQENEAMQAVRICFFKLREKQSQLEEEEKEKAVVYSNI